VGACLCMCVTKAKLSLHSTQTVCQHPQSLTDENIHMLRAFGDFWQALTPSYR
jgi:hypothetical protein